MHKALRLFGQLGVVWSVIVCIIGILAMLGLGGPLDPIFFLWVLGLFIASARLIHLRRWGAFALCTYSVWMILDSLKSGIPVWSLTWIVISSVLIPLTVRAWRTLRPGL